MTSSNDDIWKTNKKQQQQQRSVWYYQLEEAFQHFYMQFLLTTTLYVMEPWERVLVISMLLLIISLFTYSAFIFIPFHVHNILKSAMSTALNVYIH
ncbi:unnamed protein product [Rotaria socialis]|nr:unnamed protein product [Rotaria socialis]CAF3475108.1 unnamed protein product [Rotaria socialis]